MADIYLSSVDGDNADDGSTWALAKATLSAAMTAAGAGGTVYMDHAHAESSAENTSLPCNVGTVTSPIRVLCVDRTGNPEPPTALATTGTVTGTNNGGINFDNGGFSGGFAYFYGITFTGAAGGSGGNINFLAISPGYLWLESCSLRLIGDNANRSITFGLGGDSRNDNLGVTFRDTSVRFGAAAQNMSIRTNFEWLGGSLLSGGTNPTSLIKHLAGVNCVNVNVNGVNLTELGANAVFDQSIASPARFRITNCRLGASAVIATGTHPGFGGAITEAVNCDSADTNYRYFKSGYEGTVSHETVIVRTSGATDGTTAFSRKLVSSANVEFYAALQGPWFHFWDETVGSVTVSVEIITDNVTLTDAEAWIEVESLNTSGFPLSTFSNDGSAHILAAPANQSTSTEAWTTTGLTTPVKQVLSKTVTTAENGWIRCRVMLTKPSTTLYACPKIKSDSAFQYMDAEGSVINAPAAAGGGLAFVNTRRNSLIGR